MTPKTIPIEILRNHSTIDQVSGVLVAPGGQYTPEQIADLSPDAAVLYDWVQDSMDILLEHCVMAEAAGCVIVSPMLRKWCLFYSLQDLQLVPWVETDQHRQVLDAVKLTLIPTLGDTDDHKKLLKLLLGALNGSWGWDPDEDGEFDESKWEADRNRRNCRDAVLSLLRVASDTHDLDRNMEGVIRHQVEPVMSHDIAEHRFGLLCLLQPFLPLGTPRDP